jgi:hypothetical protein
VVKVKLLLQTNKLAIQWWSESDWAVDKGKGWIAFNLGRLQLIFYR